MQYTRNMVTGASTADLALVLVDARKGLIEQSRRHAFLSTLLRVPHLVLCVNKMDLVDYSEDRVRGDPLGVHRLRDQAQHPRPDVHPDLGAQGRQRRDPQREHALVRRALAAAPPRERARRLRPQPGRRPLPGAVRHPPEVRRSSTTTAATPARSPVACSSRATRSWCCRPGSPRGSRRSTPPTARSTRPSRRCR